MQVRPLAATRGRTQARPRTPRLLITWVVALTLVILHATIRGYGDEIFAARRVGGLESAIFGGVPTTWLQTHLHSRDLVWFDFVGFLFHGAWFATPWILGFAIMVRRRGMLLEYFGWIVATIYLASIVFLLCPVQPPWMEIGSVRVLQERAFIEYTGVDTNQVAAMPSLHAGLPAALGLFALVRLGWRQTAAALFAYSGGVGFFVVYLGEHWVIDVFAGWALAAAVAVVLTRPEVHRAVNALPGRPLTAFARFNAWWLPEPAPPPPATFPADQASGRRRAA